MSGLNQQMATPYFYKQLRKITKAEGIPMIVDETRTGVGASGKNWAHEYWYLHDDQSPDFVTFGGARSQGLSGYYSTLEHRVADDDAFGSAVNMVSLLNYGLVWKVMAQ